MNTLRIMSNNIWGKENNSPEWEKQGFNCSAAHRAKGLCRVYSELSPDIIGFQECSAGMTYSLIKNMITNNSIYTFLWGGETSILYRSDKFELIDSEYYIYPEDVPGFEGSFNNNESKGYNIAVLRTKKDGKLLIFATTHLWWKSSDPDNKDFQLYSDEAREYQVNILLDRVEKLIEKYKCPAVIVGDFNTTYDSKAIQTALSRKYVHGHDIATDYSDETNGHHYCFADGFDMYENPKSFKEAIDHILISNAPDGFVRKFDRYYPEYYMPLSDHFPVWIDVEL